MGHSLKDSISHHPAMLEKAAKAIKSQYRNDSHLSWIVVINGIYHVKYSVRNSLDKNQRLVVINGIYHVKYSVRNNLDKYQSSSR